MNLRNTGQWGSWIVHLLCSPFIIISVSSAQYHYPLTPIGAHSLTPIGGHSLTPIGGHPLCVVMLNLSTPKHVVIGVCQQATSTCKISMSNCMSPCSKPGRLLDIRLIGLWIFPWRRLCTLQECTGLFLSVGDN